MLARSFVFLFAEHWCMPPYKDIYICIYTVDVWPAPRPLTAGHQERLGTGLSEQSAISAVQWRQLKVPATLDGQAQPDDNPQQQVRHSNKSCKGEKEGKGQRSLQ